MLSSIHQAVETWGKINYFGQPVIKPFVVPKTNLKIHCLANYSTKKISHQSISKQLMTVFQVTRILLMITMKLNQTQTCTGNLQQNQNFQLNFISNFSRDSELEEDVQNGWKKVENDEVHNHGP